MDFLTLLLALLSGIGSITCGLIIYFALYKKSKSTIDLILSIPDIIFGILRSLGVILISIFGF